MRVERAGRLAILRRQQAGAPQATNRVFEFVVGRGDKRFAKSHNRWRSAQRLDAFARGGAIE